MNTVSTKNSVRSHDQERTARLQRSLGKIFESWWAQEQKKKKTPANQRLADAEIIQRRRRPNHNPFVHDRQTHASSTA